MFHQAARQTPLTPVVTCLLWSVHDVSQRIPRSMTYVSRASEASSKAPVHRWYFHRAPLCWSHMKGGDRLSCGAPLRLAAGLNVAAWRRRGLAQNHARLEAGVVWPKNRLDYCEETGLCGHGSPAFTVWFNTRWGRAKWSPGGQFPTFNQDICLYWKRWRTASCPGLGWGDVKARSRRVMRRAAPFPPVWKREREMWLLGVGCNQPCINKAWGMRAQRGD